MEEDVNISYAFRVDSQEPVAEQPQAAPELYALQDCERIRLHNGGTLLISNTTGATFPVTQAQSMALWNCRHFRSIDDHARILESSLPGEAQGLLNALLQAGMLSSAKDAHSRLCIKPEDSSKPAPSRVFIITCDRPAAIERLLDSIMQNAQLTRHEQLFLVDDSRQAENAEQNRELATNFSLSSPRTMHYLGAEEQAQLMSELTGQLPQHREAIEFLMDRQRWKHVKTFGLSRNLCLLMSVGYRCIVLDDDVLCQALQRPEDRDTLDLSGSSSETFFYDSEQEWRERFIPAKDDPLLGHTRWLGTNFSDLLNGLDTEDLGPGIFEYASEELVAGSDAGSKVIVTECGTLGDPGTPNNSWIMHLPSTAVKKVLASSGGLQAAFAFRQCWKGCHQLSVKKMAAVSQITGLDNTQLLPPYFPAFRGEDLLFGRLVNVIHPGSLALVYNWAIPHLPIENRKLGDIEDSVAVKGGMPLLVDYLFRHVNTDQYAPAETKLILLAAKIEELSTLSSSNISALFKTELARLHSTLWAAVDRQLSNTGDLSPEWQEYLQRARQEIINSLQQSPRMEDMDEVPDGLDEAAIIDAVRKGAAGFAAVLRAWPEIRAAAAKVGDTIFTS